MATKKGDPVVIGERQGSIEIAYVKLTGNDATLQDAVKAFSALVNRPLANGNVLAGAKRVNALPAAGSKAAPNGHGAESGVALDEDIDVDAATETEEQEVVEQAERIVAPKVTRKYAVPTAIPIDTESPMSVDEFVKQYKLDSHDEKYLALAACMKVHRQGQQLKAGHIVMLYKHLDWDAPVDITMPLRRLVSKNFQWLERTSKGEYQVHQVGESKLSKLKI